MKIVVGAAAWPPRTKSAAFAGSQESPALHRQNSIAVRPVSRSPHNGAQRVLISHTSPLSAAAREAGKRSKASAAKRAARSRRFDFSSILHDRILRRQNFLYSRGAGFLTGKVYASVPLNLRLCEKATVAFAHHRAWCRVVMPRAVRLGAGPCAGDFPHQFS